MKKKVRGEWVYITVGAEEVPMYQSKGWRVCPEFEAVAALAG